MGVTIRQITESTTVILEDVAIVRLPIHDHVIRAHDHTSPLTREHTQIVQILRVIHRTHTAPTRHIRDLIPGAAS